MDTLRDAKESQKASPPPENTAPESNPVVTPPQESQPENSSAVVVPTVEINQNQVPESHHQKEEKPQ
jgi:serine/threonine-protein kinase